MVVALGLADLPGDGPLRALECVHADDGGQQRCANHLAAAGALAFLQCGKHAERAVHAGQQVRDRYPDALHIVGAEPVTDISPASPCAIWSYPARVAFGAVVAEPADGQHHQPGIDL